MVQRSKKYREAAEKIDRNNLYTANEAIALLKSMPEQGRPAGPRFRQPAERHR